MSPAGVAVQTSPMQRQEARAVVSAMGAAPSPRRADSPFRASTFTREPSSPQSFRTTVLPSSPRGKSVSTARAGRRVSIEDMLALSALVHDTHDDDNALFGKAMHQLRDLLDADRAVLYLFDAAEGVLWTPVADGGSVLKVPVGTGLVGHAAASGDIVSVAGVVKYWWYSRCYECTFAV